MYLIYLICYEMILFLQTHHVRLSLRQLGKDI